MVASGKGGVGKSLITSSLLYLMRDLPSLVGVDADAPAPNLHLIFGVEEWEHVEEYVGGEIAEISPEKCIRCDLCVDKCIYDAIEPGRGGVPRIREYLCEGCRACGYSCPVGAITYREAVSGVIRQTMTDYGFPLISAELDVGRPNSGKLVAQERTWAREMAGKDGLVIIDAAAGIGCEVIASMSLTQMAILVAEPTPASAGDVKRAYAVAKHFGVPSYLVINKATIGDHHPLTSFAEENGIEILGTIPYDDAVPKSLSLKKPLLEVFPESEASKAIREVVMRIGEILEERS